MREQSAARRQRPREILETCRHPESTRDRDTDAERNGEAGEIWSQRYRDYKRPKETNAEVAKRSGKNMNDTDTETPRGMQRRRKTARQKRPRSLDLGKESALQRE